MTTWLLLALFVCQETPAKPEPAATDRLVRSLGSPRFFQDDIIVALATGKTHIATGDGKSAKVWDLKGGRMLYEVATAGRCVAFSKDGARFASGGAADVSVVDLATGASVWALKGHVKTVHAAAFSPDGKRLATGSDDVTVRVWDLESGKELYRVDDHLNTVYAIAYSPDGATLATASRDGTVRLWAAGDGKAIRTLRDHADDVRAIAFSPDGTTLISAGDDGAIRLWDPGTGAVRKSLSGHAKPVLAIAMSPDGSAMATGSADGEVRAWSLPAGELRYQSRAGRGINSLTFSPGGDAIFTAGDGQTPVILDAASGKVRSGLEGQRGTIQCLVLLEGGARAIAGDAAGDLLLWDLGEGKVLRRYEGHVGGVNRIAVSPDGKRAASIGRDKFVRIFGVEDGVEVARIPVEGEYGMQLAWWPDGKIVAVVANYKQLSLYEAATGRLMGPFPGPSQVFAFVVLADGRTVATAEGYGRVRLRDLETGNPRADIRMRQGLQSVVVDASGRWLVGSSGGFLVHDLKEGRTSESSRYGGGPLQPAFSPDSRYVAGFLWGKGLNVVELATGEPVLTIPIKTTRWHPQCAYLPGRDRVLAWNDDPTLAVWNVGPDGSAADKSLEDLWKDLAESAPTEAYAALGAMSSRGAEAVAFLKERLKSTPDTKEIEKLIGEASDALVTLGGDAEAPVAKAVELEKDAEKKEKLKKILDDLLAPLVKSPSTLRRLRAIEVLERIGSPDAIELLKSLAESAPSARERYEAAASAKRLAK